VEGNGFFARAVRHVASSVAAFVGDELGVIYDGVSPNRIIAMPRALAQLAHADTGRYVEVGGPGATLLTVYFSFKEGTYVDLWSGSYGGAPVGTPAEPLRPPKRVFIPVGHCLIVRSDLIHRGANNPDGRRQKRCVHFYLTVHTDGVHMRHAEHTSLLYDYV